MSSGQRSTGIRRVTVAFVGQKAGLPAESTCKGDKQESRGGFGLT